MSAARYCRTPRQYEKKVERIEKTDSRELSLETLLIFLLKRLHELSNVSYTVESVSTKKRLSSERLTSVNVSLKSLSIQLLSFRVVTGESVLRVRNEDSSVRRSLHRSENSRSSRGSLQSNVEETLERSGSVLVCFSQLESSIRLGLSFVFVGESELGKCSSGDKESSGVGCNRVSSVCCSASSREGRTHRQPS